MAAALAFHSQRLDPLCQRLPLALGLGLLAGRPDLLGEPSPLLVAADFLAMDATCGRELAVRRLVRM
jgi:hypothetical protein